MSNSEDPDWNSDNPQRWSTYYRAVYQIEGASEVVVNEYCRDERQARAEGVEALTAALNDLVKHEVRVKAAAWVIKHQSRSQTRSFPATNVHPLVTRNWYGRFAVVHGGVEED